MVIFFFTQADVWNFYFLILDSQFSIENVISFAEPRHWTVQDILFSFLISYHLCTWKVKSHCKFQTFESRKSLIGIILFRILIILWGSCKWRRCSFNTHCKFKATELTNVLSFAYFTKRILDFCLKYNWVDNEHRKFD